MVGTPRELKDVIGEGKLDRAEAPGDPVPPARERCVLLRQMVADKVDPGAPPELQRRCRSKPSTMIEVHDRRAEPAKPAVELPRKGIRRRDKDTASGREMTGGEAQQCHRIIYVLNRVTDENHFESFTKIRRRGGVGYAYVIATVV